MVHNRRRRDRLGPAVEGRQAPRLRQCCHGSRCRSGGSFCTTTKNDGHSGVAKALSLIGAIYVHEKSNSKKKLDGPANTGLPAETQYTGNGRILRLVRYASPACGSVAGQPVCTGSGLSGGARITVAGVPRRSGSVTRYQRSRKLAQADTNRETELVIRLDRAGLMANRRNPRLARHLQTTGSRYVSLPSRCSERSRLTSRETSS